VLLLATLLIGIALGLMAANQIARRHRSRRK
jgi:hypothetical protein